MSNIKIIGNIERINRKFRINQEDLDLLDVKEISNFFEPGKDYIERFVYDESDIIYSDFDYKSYKLPHESFIKNGFPEIEIDPIKDLENNSFKSGYFTIQYNFFRSNPNEFFIDEISSDRTEIRLKHLTTVNFDNLISNKILSEGTTQFLLSLDNNRQILITNSLVEDNSLLIKLYEPLYNDVTIKNRVSIVEEIITPYIFTIDLDLIIIPDPAPSLKGPNFNIDTKLISSVQTTYVNNNAISDYNNNRSSLNIAKNKSIKLNIDYSNYSNFIHFSSAVSRLNLFISKLKKIELIKNNNLWNNESLIEAIVSKFDGYEDFLYSQYHINSWPKTTYKPYILTLTNNPIATSWINTQTDIAVIYDSNNQDILTDLIPLYIKNDEDNYAPYFIFINMIAHHFDNIWIYTKDITNLYNNNNDLNEGTSKELIEASLRSLGISLLDSPNNTLNKVLKGNNNGLVNFIDDFSANSNYINNIPENDYRYELYKRIYHNLPLLLKTKGTRRGIELLINIFGINEDILEVKYLENFDFNVNSNDNIIIRTNNPNNLLSDKIRNNIDTTNNKSQILDVSFSPQNNVSNIIKNNTPNFDVAQYIGDPQGLYRSKYKDLNQLKEEKYKTNIPARIDYNLFIKTINYFNYNLFKLIKDFAPVSSAIITDISVKSPMLERNKIKLYKPSGNITEIPIANIEGPTISEPTNNSKQHYSKDRIGYYNGDLNNNVLNLDDDFKINNYNPNLIRYTRKSRDSFERSDFNSTLHNIGLNRKSISHLILYPLYKKLADGTYIIEDYITKNNFNLNDSYPELQDSDRQSYPFVNARYKGVKITSKEINKYTPEIVGDDYYYPGDISYGTSVAVGIYSDKIALIINVEPNLTLGGKSSRNSISIKYLIDKDGGLTELNQINRNLFEVQNIFKPGTTATISLFDDKINNQRLTNGVKPIISSGYTYEPLFYAAQDDVFFKFEYDESIQDKLFRAKNIEGGYIAGGPTIQYPNYGGVYYNIFDVDIDPSDSYTVGNGPTSLIPNYVVPKAGKYRFNVQFNIFLKFVEANQRVEYKFSILDKNGVNVSSLKEFSSSLTFDIDKNTYALLPYAVPLVPTTIVTGTYVIEGKTVTNPKFWLYKFVNKLTGEGVSLWINRPSPYSRREVAAPGPFIIPPDNTNTEIKYVNNNGQPKIVSNGLSGVVEFNMISSFLDYVLGDKIEFKFEITALSTLNYTATVSTGEITASSQKNMFGGDPVLLKETPLISSTSIDNILTLDKDLSSFYGYTYVPSNTDDLRSELYPVYGDVDNPFILNIEDVIIMEHGGKYYEFQVKSFYFENEQLRIVLDKPLPSLFGTNLVTGLTKFVILRRKPNETNLILKFKKKVGKPSLGFLIPHNLNPSFLDNIDNITKEIKQKFLDYGVNP